VESDDLVDALPDLLRRCWGLHGPVEVAAIQSGMNSAAADVRMHEGRYAAKWVSDQSRQALESGAHTARRMTEGGLVAGEPLLTSDGSATVRFEGGAVALLSWVPGTPLLGGSSQDQVRMATTLAQAHRIGGSETQRGRFFGWVTPDAPGTDVEPWVGPAVAAARAEFDSLPELTWGVLHTDPAPEAFLLDVGTDDVGLIDWTGATRGPLLYDVASAVMYLGGEATASAFLRAYTEVGPVHAGEVAEHLSALLRFRAAVQATYFAGRIARRDLTGIADDSENWKGLHDARKMFVGLGVDLREPEARPAAQRGHAPTGRAEPGP
jgi:Ser/Thr protein kinase RdoA (MazF antagonist)